jgi:tetratricopeptide (TPR) repeat protein
MMREAAQIAPDLPYGALMEGLLALADYQEMQQWPSAVTGVWGVSIRPQTRETAEMAQRRKAAQELLDRARGAKVWGAESAADFQAAIDGLAALNVGESERALKLLDRALDSPDLRAFEHSLRVARAQARYLRGDFEGALGDLEGVLEARPGSHEALACTGQVKYAMGARAMGRGEDPRPFLAEAVKLYQRAATLRTAGPGLWMLVGHAFLQLAQARLYAGGDVIEAAGYGRDAFEHAAELDASEPDARHGAGMAWVLQGKVEGARGADPRPSYDRAITALTEAIERMASWTDYHNSRGVALFRRGEAEGERGGDPTPWFDRALRDFETVLAREPAHVEALTNRAMLRQTIAERSSDPRPGCRAAIADYDAAIKARPLNPEGWNNRATALLSIAGAEQDPREALRDAIRSCDEGLTSCPWFAELLNTRGHAWGDLAEAEAKLGGDPSEALDRAISDFDETLKRNAESVGALVGRAEARRRRGDRARDGRAEYARGVEDYTAALKLNPGMAAGYYNRGNLHLQIGQEAEGPEEMKRAFEAAIADYGEFLRRKPGHAQALHNRGGAHYYVGLAKLKLGEEAVPSFERAVEDAAAALRASPDRADSAALRGDGQARIGDRMAAAGREAESAERYARAVAAYDEAIRLDGGQWRYHSAKGTVLEATGDKAGARRCYEEAIKRGAAEEFPEIEEWLRKVKE